MSGSYRYGGFDADDRELNRLVTQASKPADIERELMLEVGVCPGLSILDLGCGPGVISRMLAMLASPGEVLGLDVSPELIAAANQGAEDAGLKNLTFETGDVYALDLPDNHFDLVYARFLLQHLKSPARALKEAIRVLKPGGRICVLDVDDGWLSLEPEPEGFASFLDRAARGQSGYGGDRRIGRQMQALLLEAGFKEVGQRVRVVTSAELGLKTFLDIISGLKMEMIPQEERAAATQEREAMYRLLENDAAWGGVGVFVGLGTAP